MSHDLIERGYEEQLKAEAPKLLLRLDGKLVQTFYDTPSGRRTCDKAAFRLIGAHPDAEVRVDRTAGGGQAESHDPKGGAAPAIPPAMRPTEGCCVPATYPGPSGVLRRHSMDCPEAAGSPWREPVRREPSVGHLQRRLAAETIRTGLDDAVRRHPASGVLTATDDRCPAHPAFRWDECPEYDERSDR